MDAIENLKAAFARRLDTSLDLEHYRGADWWQLSHAQQDVFGIELEDMPALVTAWELYEAVADIAHNDFHGSELAKALQADMPWIQPRVSDPEAWSRFAALLGIRSGRAFQWFWKHHFEHENTWTLKRDDDGLPMPRPARRNVLPTGKAAAEDDGIPF